MQDWWSPTEIATANLPDLPGTKRGVTDVARREDWQAHPGLARRRCGRGGGWEYHRSLFPARAQSILLKADAKEIEADAPNKRDRAQVWAEFDRLTAKAKEKAKARLATINAVQKLLASGEGKAEAIAIVANLQSCSARSIWNWLDSIAGVPELDWLAYLAPRHQTATRKVKAAVISAEAWEYFKTLYLRQGEVGFSKCYRDLSETAAHQGWTIPSEQSLRRKARREIRADVLVRARKGEQALKALYPAQVRTKTSLHAMQAVNGDYHKWDVFVNWNGRVIRPQTCVWSDLHTAKMLGFRHTEFPNAWTTQLTFGDVIEDWGIPEEVVMDNGREFTAKAISGGAEFKFRGKETVDGDDVEGIMTMLGINVHFTQVYSGQSKPIERGFRDFCGDIAKDIRFADAYCGNRPGARPEDVRKPVDFETFCAVVEEGIRAHNARLGRTSEVCAGRSLDQAFAESYALHPVRKATDEQRRFFMLRGVRRRTNSNNGEIRFEGNKYWSPWLTGFTGEPVIIRFDPANLHEGVFIYDQDERFLGFAECHAPVGFFSDDDKRTHNRARRHYEKAIRTAQNAELTMSKAKAGEMLAEARAAAFADEPVEAKVIRPVFNESVKAPTRPEQRALTEAEAARHEAIVAEFVQPAKVEAPEDEDLERYREAVRLEAQLEAGNDIGPASLDWLRSYQKTPQYLAYKKLRQRFGDSVIA